MDVFFRNLLGMFRILTFQYVPPEPVRRPIVSVSEPTESAPPAIRRASGGQEKEQTFLFHSRF